MSQYSFIVISSIKNTSVTDKNTVSTFVPNKSFDQLLNISPVNHIYTEIFVSEFSYIGAWFTDQNSKLNYNYILVYDEILD